MKLQSGDRLPPWRLESVDAENIRLLADVLGDPNPIHLDPAAVAAAGLGDRVINQGPANLAYVLNMIMQAGLEPISLEARFTGSVRAGDSVEATGEGLPNVQAEGAKQEVSCEFKLSTGAGDTAIQGVALVKVASERTP